jgi:hypothetical protein
MQKRIIGAFALAAAAALCIGPAMAERANTSQKGSLLIFPEINIDSTSLSNTYIEVSNDQNTAVHVECSYIEKRKGRLRLPANGQSNGVVERFNRVW